MEDVTDQEAKISIPMPLACLKASEVLRLKVGHKPIASQACAVTHVTHKDNFSENSVSEQVRFLLLIPSIYTVLLRFALMSNQLSIDYPQSLVRSALAVPRKSIS